MKNFSRHIGRIGSRYLSDRCMGEEEEEEGVYSYSSDTVEGPRTPAVKLTARQEVVSVTCLIGIWNWSLFDSEKVE